MGMIGSIAAMAVIKDLRAVIQNAEEDDCKPHEILDRLTVVMDEIYQAADGGWY